MFVNQSYEGFSPVLVCLCCNKWVHGSELSLRQPVSWCEGSSTPSPRSPQWRGQEGQGQDQGSPRGGQADRCLPLRGGRLGRRGGCPSLGPPSIWNTDCIEWNAVADKNSKIAFNKQIWHQIGVRMSLGIYFTMAYYTNSVNMSFSNMNQGCRADIITRYKYKIFSSLI